MADISLDIILIPLLQLAQRSIEFLLVFTLLLHAILIISFLGVTWNRNNSQSDALKARRVVLGLYIVLLVIDASIYIGAPLIGGVPYIRDGFVMMAEFFNPGWFFIFLSPPTLLMYFDINSPKSSGLYNSLSNSGLALLIWLVVIAIAFEFSRFGVIIY